MGEGGRVARVGEGGRVARVGEGGGGWGGWGKGGGCGSYTVLGQFTYPFPDFPHVKWLLNGFFAQQTSLPSVTGFDLLSEYNF